MSFFVCLEQILQNITSNLLVLLGGNSMSNTSYVYFIFSHTFSSVPIFSLGTVQRIFSGSLSERLMFGNKFFSFISALYQLDNISVS